MGALSVTSPRGHELVDACERVMAENPTLFDPPLTHRFTPGLYVREIFIPAGTLLTSKIHKTEHPFVISQGVISVWSEDRGVEHLYAPHTGITKPGTRRVLYAHTDTVWTTFHPSEETDVGTLEAQLIEPRNPRNPLQIEIEYP